MIVTDKEYYVDQYLLNKLDLIIKRLRGTDDAIIIVDGDEGQGKSEFTCGMCYYVAYNLKREYNINNIFFELDKAIEFAAKTKDQVIHIDEGALGLLTTQWGNKIQQKFIQLVMVARKKRHFIAICIPKFHRMAKYIIEDRSIALINIYSRKNTKKGNYRYFKKMAKDKLYYDWLRKKTRNYRKYKTFKGTFVLAMKKVLGEEGIEQYDLKKDKAILNVAKSDEKKEEGLDRHQKKLNEMKKKVYEFVKIQKIPVKEALKHFEISHDTFPKWKRLETDVKN